MSTPTLSIVCSAIKHEASGCVAVGKRHDQCIHTLCQLTGKQVGQGYTQGFLTSGGAFVGRKEAADIALARGQVKELRYFAARGELDSHDLY